MDFTARRISPAAVSVAALLLAGCSEPDASRPFVEVCPNPFGFRLLAGGLDDVPDPGPACRRPVVESALPADQVNHLGSRTVGEVVRFDVRPGTRSLTIVSQRVSAVDSIQFPFGGTLVTLDNSVVPTFVTQPDGRMVFDDTDARYFPADPRNLPAYYGGLSASTGAMTIPDTSSGLSAWRADGVAPGTWSFTVNDWAYECAATPGCLGGSSAGVYDITVVAKPGAPAAVATLDVAFHLVTPSVLGGLTSATAVSHPDVKRMVAALAVYLSGSGLCLGQVTFYDVPAWARARYATLDVDQTGPCSDLGQMFTLSRPGRTLDFFLVDEMVSTTNPGYFIVGMDGTIPGPSGFGGTVQSGAAVSAADMGFGTCGPTLSTTQCGDDVTAYIAAHEAGHWLGLYHTTEQTGDLFDPLADTATCRCDVCAPLASRSSCASSPGQVGTPYLMLGKDCTQSAQCGGGDDLMFWLIDTEAKGALTPEQGEVIRANPLAH
jgi:hypothetical protein